MNDVREITLRVAGHTNPNDLRMAIVGHLQSGRTVYVDALGEKANYRALKSVVGARQEGAAKGLTINHNVIQTNVTTFGDENVVVTAFRWILSAS